MSAVDPLDPIRTYAEVLDALPIVAWMASPDGMPSFFSDGFKQYTGHAPDRFANAGYAGLIHPDDRERATRTWAAALGDGSPYRDEMRIELADGTYRWIISEAAPVRRDGAIAGWIGSVTDIDSLRSTEARFAERARFVERLLDASDDCVKILDLEGRLLEMSPNGRVALGIRDFDAVRGNDWIAFWRGEDRVAASAALASARAGGRGRFVGRYDVDGQDKRWSVTATPVVGASGEPEQLLVVSRDVTENVRANEGLARSEARFRALAESLPGVTWTADANGAIDHVTRGPELARQHEATAAPGDAWLGAVHPDDLERARASWRHAIATGEPYDATFRLAMADGRYRHQLSRGRAQRNERGEIERWVGVSLDVENERRADESRDQLVRLVDASDDFIGIVDPEGRVTYANAAARAALGIPGANGNPHIGFLEVFAPEDRAFVEDTILPTIAQDERWLGEFRLKNLETGKLVPVSYNTFALRDEAGRTTGFGSVARDLRERRRYEIGMQALAEAGAAMYGSLDVETTASNVTAAVTRTFATICSIEFLQPDGTLRTLTATHRNPALRASLARAIAARTFTRDHPAVRASERGETTLMTTLPEDWYDRSGIAAALAPSEIASLDARSVISVPIRSAQQGRVFGALTCTIDGDDPRGAYTAEDVRFAEEIAIRAALAFEHARSFERERRIAATLQEASLPGVLPTVDHLYLSAEYRPGRSEATIGGDWYDAFPIDDGRVAITIGDVLGKGLLAAVTMAKVRQAMQSVALVLPDPNTMLAAADRTVRAQSPDTYATALAGIYDPVTHVFTYASAGHPSPLLRHADGRIESFDSPGIMLGLRPAEPGALYTVTVPPGSMLAFFTDGVLEATRDIDEGLRRIRAALSDEAVAGAESPAFALVEHVLAGEPASDDIAVLIAEVGPSPRFDERLRTSKARALELGLAQVADSGHTGIAAQKQSGTVVTMPARFSDLSAARRDVRTILETAGLAGDRIDLSELAAGELLANAIEHGDGSAVSIAIHVLDDTIVLAVTNEGPAFVPHRADLTDMLTLERGRGLTLLERLGWLVAVDREDGGRCTVTASLDLLTHGA